MVLKTGHGLLKTFSRVECTLSDSEKLAARMRLKPNGETQHHVVDLKECCCTGLGLVGHNVACCTHNVWVVEDAKHFFREIWWKCHVRVYEHKYIAACLFCTIVSSTGDSTFSCLVNLVCKALRQFHRLISTATINNDDINSRFHFTQP